MWEMYPLSNNQLIYDSTDSLVALLAYLNGAQPNNTLNHYQVESDDEDWNFGPNDNLNEFNQFVEELASKQIVEPSNANESFELEDASNNELIIEQPVEPSTSKKSISLDQYKKRKAQESLEQESVEQPCCEEKGGILRI